MASRTSFTYESEQALRQIAAESLLSLSIPPEQTAKRLPGRDDHWAMVMGGRPSRLETPSLVLTPEGEPHRTAEIVSEAVEYAWHDVEAVQNLPDMTAECPQVEDEVVDEYLPKRPRRNPQRGTKPQDPVLVDMRSELPQPQQVEEAALGQDVFKGPRRNPPRAAKTQEPLLGRNMCPDSLQPVVDKNLNASVLERPRRNPSRAAKPQGPLLTKMRPGSLRPVVDKNLNASVPKRPRRDSPRAAKPQEREARPSLPDSRPKRSAGDEAPEGHEAKRPRVCDQVGQPSPYQKPSLPTRELVVEAILSAPDKKMSIQDIKQYFQSNYPWFTWGHARSKVIRTIQHALVRRRELLEEVPEQKGYWRVTAEYLDHLRGLRRILEEE